MLSKIKLFLLNLRSQFCRLWIQTIHKVRVGEGAYIHGIPTIRRCKGSHIVLKDHVTLTSCTKLRQQPLISQAAFISTMTPDAEVIFEEYSGVSGIRIVCSTKVHIGKYSIIGPDTILLDTSFHEYNESIGWGAWSASGLKGAPIIIGEKCYIGMCCIILKGVTIGDRCVVAAGTLVDRNIPAGHLAKGNPMEIFPLPSHKGGPQNS